MVEYKTIKVEELGNTGVFKKIRLEVSSSVIQYISGFPEKIATGYIAREGNPDYDFFTEFHSAMKVLNPDNRPIDIERKPDSRGLVYYISIPLEK